MYKNGFGLGAVISKQSHNFHTVLRSELLIINQTVMINSIIKSLKIIVIVQFRLKIVLNITTCNLFLYKNIND
jgi:hypothetical protein